MKLIDNVVMKGRLELFITNKYGKIMKRMNLGDNIVTNQGRSNLAHLLAGDETTDRIVDNLKAGDGGHDPLNPTVPLPVDASDTALFGTLIISKTTTYDFPDGATGYRVRFTADILPAEGNGTGSQEYSEVGLYDVTGRMMTHKTFGLITKTADFGLSFRYTISM